MAEQSLGQRDSGRGEALLERALRIAAPELIRRPFLEAGVEVRALLNSTAVAGRNRWLRERAAQQPEPTSARVPLQLTRSNGPDVMSIVMPLTAKETEVLGYLAELLTTDEIAASMFVSVNTVRSHVRSILRKLGVSRRNEAVRRAWGLGLLPSAGGASSTTVAR
jgi:LuxR family maltose regulon positive regulatory protein